MIATPINAIALHCTFVMRITNHTMFFADKPTYQSSKPNNEKNKNKKQRR